MELEKRTYGKRKSRKARDKDHIYSGQLERPILYKEGKLAEE